MATDATGTPTSPDSIPTYNTAIDDPTGNGFNAAMAAIQTALSKRPGPTITSLTTNDVPVWNGSTWVRPSGTGNSSTYLRGDGTWAAVTSIPTGVIEMYGAAAAPSGWALCDGSSVLRSGGGYDALFAIIGTTYGFVDGTHFTLPDLRGRVPAGYAASGGHTDVSALGNNDGVAVANRRSKHRHTPHSHTISPSVISATAGATGGASTNAIQLVSSTQSADGGSGNVNDSLDAPAYLVVNFIIKL